MHRNLRIIALKTSGFLLFRLVSSLLFSATPLISAQVSQQGSGDAWLDEWELPDGFAIRIDTEGFQHPTAITFVPNPGKDPKSPLYFVTEIRGKVKVVTQDRSIFTFAEGFFNRSPSAELPSPDGETGLAGVVLDPAHGFVFVSFAYMGTNRTLRNGLMRFDSTPGTFGLKATGRTSLSEIFKKDISRVGHQIGPMVVSGNELFVAVGDGGQHFKSQNLDSTLGKILRMTLDGEPLPDNPFYEPGISGPASLIWARGLRNAFGLCQVTNRLLASENGFDVDRFLEIRRGGNYNWDGSDWSIGMNTPMVFSPTVAPVQVAWMPPDHPVFPPEYRSKVFIALAGGKSFAAGVAMLDYDFARSQLASRPRQFALHIDEKRAELDPAGLAVGPDGLYLVPVYPVRKTADARGTVLRISYDPAHSLSARSGHGEEAQRIMLRAGCYSCHGTHPNDLNVGPPLDRETLVPRILGRLKSASYIDNIRQIDGINAEPYGSYRSARQSVLKAEGMEKAHLWIKYHVMEPTFDQQSSAMPNLGLKEKEAQSVADYLMRRNIGDIGVTGFFKSLTHPYLYGPVKRRHLAAGLATGFFAGVILAGAVARICFARRRRAVPRS